MKTIKTQTPKKDRTPVSLQEENKILKLKVKEMELKTKNFKATTDAIHDVMDATLAMQAEMYRMELKQVESKMAELMLKNEVLEKMLEEVRKASDKLVQLTYNGTKN